MQSRFTCANDRTTLCPYAASRRDWRTTMLVAVMSQVTLPSVARVSGSVSTANIRPSGLTGTPMAWATGRLVAMNTTAPGRPTEPRLMTTASKAPPISCAEERSMPNAQAMNTAEVTYCTGLVSRHSVTAMGRTSEVTCCGQPRRSSALSSMAGSEASDDCVLNATTCGGTSAGTKRRRRSPPQSKATGNISAVTARYIRHSTSTYTPSALNMLMPDRADTEKISAKTPSGASASTQRTMTIMASAMVWKKSSSNLRRSGITRIKAKPRNRANTTSGSMALCAAAMMALLGMIALTASVQSSGAACAVAVVAAWSRVARSAGSCGNRENTPGATAAVNNAPPVNSTMKTTMARRATRPDAAASDAVLTPITINANTSGTTVICSPLSHNMPMGCTTCAACAAVTGSYAASNNPLAAPSASPSSTREVAFILILMPAPSRPRGSDAAHSHQAENTCIIPKESRRSWRRG